jgi:hypothetical protein
VPILLRKAALERLRPIQRPLSMGTGDDPSLASADDFSVVRGGIP